MTKKELIKLGFKKKHVTDDYWFELNLRNHKFLTNDSVNNNGKDKWFVAYMNTKEMDEYFWFNNKLNTVEAFLNIKTLLLNKK